MEALFLKLLNMSITASWLVLAVVILRFLLKKASKSLTVILWALVGLRLIFPFSFESVFSLIPSTETIPNDIAYSPKPAIDSGISAINSAVNPIITENFSPNAGYSVNPMQVITYIASIVWLIGIAAMLLYSLISYLYLKHKVKISLLYRDNIYICDSIDTPFILGIFRPRIYLPSGLGEEQIKYVVEHENAHLERKDHLWKPLGFALLSIYWFNPVLWAAYILLCRDIEFACDERVIKNLDKSGKKGYSEALITCSVHRRMILACPLAFGEVGVKGRIKSVLNYKKPAFWIILAAVVASIAMSIAFLTTPPSKNIQNILDEKGFTITAREKYDFDISIPKNVITDKAFTSDGQIFKENEVIVYETDTSTVYLEKIMLSNESDEQLYLIFNFSYHDINKFDSILLPYIKSDKGYSSCLDLNSKNIIDNENTYENSVSLRAHGPSEQFTFYASTEVIKNAVGTINIDAACNRLFYEKKSLFGNGKKIDETLSVFLDVQIYNHFESEKNNDYYRCMDYEILRTEKNGDKTTVYMWVLYQEYSYDNGLKLESGSHIPTVITAKKVSGYYELAEYWEPRDGSYYTNDIKAKFPVSLHIKALNSQLYIDKQKAKCEKQANELLTAISTSGSVIEATPFLDVLKNKHPRYFELDVSDGLSVYIWQMSEDNYSCAVFEGKHTVYAYDKLLNTDTLSFKEMQAIVWYYNLSWEDVTVRAVTVPHSSYYIDSLKIKYPQYFDLTTAKGLEVYIWQTAENSYYCGVLPGRNLDYTYTSLQKLTPVSITDMKLILETYDIPKEDILIIPIIKYSSSYSYIIDKAYLEKIQKLFGADSNVAYRNTNTYDEWGLRMVVKQSGNSFEMVFTNNQMLATEKGTLTTGPEYEIRAIYNGESISFGDYMRNVLNMEYEDRIFAWDTVLDTIPDASHDTTKSLTISGSLHLVYDDILPKGEYVVCKPVTLTTPEGERITKTYNAIVAIVD